MTNQAQLLLEHPTRQSNQRLRTFRTRPSRKGQTRRNDAVKRLLEKGVPSAIALCIQAHGGDQLSWSRRGESWWCFGSDTVLEIEANQASLTAAHYTDGHIQSSVSFLAGERSPEFLTLVWTLRQEQRQMKEELALF